VPKFGTSIYSIVRCLNNKTHTPEDAVRWLCENGSEVIEIVPFGGINLVTDSGMADRLRAAADEFGVKIDNYSDASNFLGKTPDEMEAEFQRVKTTIKAASQLGISTCRFDVVGGRKPEELVIEKFLQDLPIIAQVYTELSEFAKEHGIVMMNENHGFHVNGAERVRLVMENVKSDNFGHQLDVGNYICVDDTPEVVVGQMMPYATTVHMKDFYVRRTNPGAGWFRSRGGQYLRGSIVGQGDLDMAHIVGAVKKHGFDGNIYIEFEGAEDHFHGAKTSLDNVKRLWEAV